MHVAAVCSDGDIRVVGESEEDVKDGRLRGRVEVCLRGRYGTICDETFNGVDASVICRQLGLSPYGNLRNLSMTNPVHKFYVSGLLLYK